MKLGYLSPTSQLQEKRTYCMQLEERLENRMQNMLLKQKHRLSLYVEQMKGLSPLEKLSQGYAFVENSKGQVANRVSKVTPGERLQIYVKDGQIQAQVLEIQEGWEMSDGRGIDTGADV